jgi:hypothetical protein
MATLIERVSCAIDGRIDPDQWLHRDAARAAIREVAEALLQPGHRSASAWLTNQLEREATR